MRLVNVGPSDRARRGELGYPICTVCGAVRSPYASERELQHIQEIHRERCGKVPEPISVTVDSYVDGILFQGIADRETAVNLGEGLRIGAARVLEKEARARGDQYRRECARVDAKASIALLRIFTTGRIDFLEWVNDARSALMGC